MAPRKKTPERTEADVLVASRRRCALCFGLYGDLDQKRGQIAHVDRDPANASFENLAFLCLPHHDEYDSRTSQSKRFTPEELIEYRRQLYARLGDGVTENTVGSATVVLSTHDARKEACVELERDAGFLVERVGSWQRIGSDAQVISATIARFEGNIGLVRRDSALTQAVRDFAHQCKIILSEDGMFGNPRERMAETSALRGYFDAFIRAIDAFMVQPKPAPAAQPSPELAPFFTLVSGSFSAGVLDFHIRNDADPVTVVGFQARTVGCHIRQWYPTSLPTGEVFRSSVDLDDDLIPSCVFELRVRDRASRERIYELRLDRQSSPQKFEFVELSRSTTAS